MALQEHIALSELESMADGVSLASLESIIAETSLRRDDQWLTYQQQVVSAFGGATSRLRLAMGERAADLIRLLEIEEQTRCQAFQATLMGEVRAPVYQTAVRSILEKVLAKLETLGAEPLAYQAAAQCLSEYMSALNHHAEICASGHEYPPSRSSLPAIDEGSALGYQSDHSCSIRSEESLATSHRSEETLSMLSDADSLYGRAHALSADGSGLSLAPEDPRDAVRKERRRESNKKAATKYRSKKSANISAMMAENAALHHQAAGLSSQVAVLAAENRLLKQQMGFLQNLLQGNPELAAQLAAAGAAGGSASAAAAAAAAPAPTAAPTAAESTVVGATGMI